MGRQCCGSGYGSGMNDPDQICERLKTIFWVKILKFFDVDPGWKKFGSGINTRIRNTVGGYPKRNK
jgi:hypothetical protein